MLVAALVVLAAFRVVVGAVVDFAAVEVVDFAADVVVGAAAGVVVLTTTPPATVVRERRALLGFSPGKKVVGTGGMVKAFVDGHSTVWSLGIRSACQFALWISRLSVCFLVRSELDEGGLTVVC